MISNIQLLDQNTINKIAAGEVVERPASVVKELVENAIDAKATAITVEIKEGGLSSIRITDNGIGIDASDIRNAFLRHSTSKIRGIDDLLTIASLGFRGEALASIASVSQVELITKTYSQLTGIRYIIEGGFEKAYEEIGCPEGTTIIINNIFYNTPARRKFLKTPITEAAYIAELMNKLALGNPQVSFKFINNGQVKLHTSGNNKLYDSIFTVYGKDITKNLITINYNKEPFSVNGYIGKPIISRANRNYENYYINGRYIKSKVVQKAIEDAYKSKLTLHQYPFSVFHIIIDTQAIDVNVHPTKMDIRFNNEKQVYDEIYQTIFDALNQSELIPQVTFERYVPEIKTSYSKNIPEPFEQKRREITYPSVSKSNDTKENIDKLIKSVYELKEEVKQEAKQTAAKCVQETYTQNEAKYSSKDLVKEETISNLEIVVKSPENSNNFSETQNTDAVLKGEQLDYKQALFTDNSTMKEHKIIGQLFNTYWIIEFKEKYYIIDQHAAHERVLYEKILEGLKHKDSFSQVLLQPIIVRLSMKEKLRLEAHQSLFEELGFDVEDFGGDDIAIRSVPYIFERPIHPSDFIRILDKLDDEYKEEKYDIMLDELSSMACKAAVKAHDKLSEIEYSELIDQLLKLENPFNCPHGRPTIISMTKYELEKKFKRIQ